MSKSFFKKFIFALAVMLMASPSWAAPAQAAPTQAVPGFCELAALPALPLAADTGERFSPEELLNRVAESYRGLLEFAGDEFSEARLEMLLRDGASPEKFFEPVAVAEQRSVALNESLTRLGDWVLLEAEDQGLTADTIRARLREVVRTHLDRATQEQERTEETREERRNAGSAMRYFEMPNGTLYASRVFVDGGSKLMTTGTHRQILLWDLETLSKLDEFEVPPAVRSIQGLVLSPTLAPLPDPDRILIYYPGTNHVEIWNWRIHQLVRAFELPQGKVYREGISLSPLGRWMVVPFTETSEFSNPSYYVYDIENELVAATVHRSPVWSPDDRRFAMIQIQNSNQPPGFERKLELWELSSDESGHEKFSQVFSVLLDFEAGDLSFTLDSSHLVIDSESELRGFRFDALGIHQEWKVDRWSEKVYGEFMLWRQAHGELITVSEGSQNLWILDPKDGNQLAELSAPSPRLIVAQMELSPSGKYLAVGYSDERTILIWDLETRQVLHRISTPYEKRTGFIFSPDGRFLLISGRGRHRFQVWNLENLDES